MDPEIIFKWILCGFLFIFVLWVFGRIFVWQVARFMKTWFKIDIQVASVGLLTAYGIAIRVNDLQSLEIDHVKLKIRPKCSHVFSLQFGDVRIRAERNHTVQNSVNSTTTEFNGGYGTGPTRKSRFLQWLVGHIAINVDAVNIMILNAFFLDSLLHLDVTQVRLEGGARHIVQLATAENKAKHPGQRVIEDIPTEAFSANLGGMLSFGEIKGKILRSDKEGVQGNTCIAEVLASLQVGVVASLIQNGCKLEYVAIDFEKFSVELHSGAFIPGSILPNKATSLSSDLCRREFRSLPELLMQTGPLRTALMLPILSRLKIRTFNVLIFGEPSSVGPNVKPRSGVERVLQLSISSISLSQRKDPKRMVIFENSDKFPGLNIPTGYIRTKFEDFTLTNACKMSLMKLSRVCTETKMTVNGVLSSSLDFTLCHIQYIHQEAEYWIHLLHKKQLYVDPLKQQPEKLKVISADLPRFEGASYNRPSSEKIPRKNKNTLRNTEYVKNTSPHRMHMPSTTFGLAHKRTQSAPDKIFPFSSGEYCRGVTSKSSEVIFFKDFGSLAGVFDALGISTVFECTFYETMLDISLPQLIIPHKYEKTCTIAFGLDCITMSIDHSANSEDVNFMTKLDNFWWQPRTHFTGDASCGFQPDSMWSEIEVQPCHKTNIHEWGTAFKLDTLRLHGQANYSDECYGKKRDDKIRKSIGVSIDAKVAGFQYEFSQLATMCIANLISCMAGKKHQDHHEGSASRESYTTNTNNADTLADVNQKKLSFTLSFLEAEVNHVNIFLLPDDDTGCAECLVARIDSIKSEANLRNHRLTITGIGIMTVPNPCFSAFTNYETGYDDGKGRYRSTRPFLNIVPPSIRQQQNKVSRYICIPANEIHPLHFGLNAMDLEYKVFDQEEVDTDNHSLSISLCNDGDVKASWSPTLHMLVHNETLHIIQILRKIVESFTSSYPSVPQSDCYQDSMRNEMQVMAGDAIMDCETSDDMKFSFESLQISVASNSRICFNVTLKEDAFVEFHFSPIRFTKASDVSSLLFTKAQIVMDHHVIFNFMNVKIEMSAENENLRQARDSFNDLKTEGNRVLNISTTYWSSLFPHNYDFAATFDQFVSTFKWVKGLYRKTSQPFRSSKLPPDLLIVVDQFVFEIADWDFECRLHDNHELMKDEWRESEKRRKILDQRVADLRRERGELLPAKKIAELYLKLEEQNTRIYVERCKKLNKSKISDLNCEGILSQSSLPQKSHSSSNSQTVESSLHPTNNYFGVLNDSVDSAERKESPTLFKWSITSITIAVLADESMHGMENAIQTLQKIDKVAVIPNVKINDQDAGDYDFVTLWCRNIRLHVARHQCRIRNYPQYLMDVCDWRVWGKLCGAEQKGSQKAQRTEYIPLSPPWTAAKVERNMPALKFYHDLNSDVQSFSMAWGPSWDPAWSQVNLAVNLLNHPSIDPSPQLPWWDKARIIFHGRLMMSMDRSSLLQLASLDPYNTTEHLHWDWKTVLMDWTNGNFLFRGDLDVHIRNASKYDDIRFLHLPNLQMELDINWICRNNADPNDHHAIEPCSPDKVVGDLQKHDSFRNFRSENLDLSANLVVHLQNSNGIKQNADILFYSTTLRWLTNFARAINAVTRPVSKGSIFNNHTQPKVKLSRHYRNNTLSFKFPTLKMRYWSSYTQQLGIEWRCGKGDSEIKCKQALIPFEGPLQRRSRGNWSVNQATCELYKTKIYLLKRPRNSARFDKEPDHEIDPVNQQSYLSESSPLRGNIVSNVGDKQNANFLLSLSYMSYRLENSVENVSKSRSSSGTDSNTAQKNEMSGSMRNQRKSSHYTGPPKKPTSQHRHQLIVHDLRAMWTTDNRDVGFGLYEGYNKAAILKHNLSTKVLKNILLKPTELLDETPDRGRIDNIHSSGTMTVSAPMSPGEKLMQDGNILLNQLLSETDVGFIVGPEEPSSRREQLKGMAACQVDDVINQNWRIKFVNCQAMLKGPKTQGYIILTAADVDLMNRDHKIAWRDEQLTSKSTWIGSLNDMQIFATVERNVSSSGEDVPWLTTTNIEPRGPSPGMLDISDLMTAGQAIGGVVGDGVSAGPFQLQRIMSRCSCRMYFVGYESIVDSGDTDYGQLLSPLSSEKVYQKSSKCVPSMQQQTDLLEKEKPVNILTVVQQDLEICTNTSQYSMILDIVENLLLYVEPGMRQHWERVDRMRFQLQLASTSDVAGHRQTLTQLQDEIRQRLNDIRQLEKDLYMIDRLLEKDPDNENLLTKSSYLQQTLVNEKDTLKEDSEELGIIIRCFKERYLKQKTRNSTRIHQLDRMEKWDEEVRVVRKTEVSFSQVKWHLTDEDGQLTIAKFELRNFLYDKVNKSNDSLEHLFELGWLRLQNLVPNSIYLDVLKPQGPVGAKSHTVVGSGSQRLSLRALCKVRPPVGGISIKEHLELNVVPLNIQLTDQFFKRMMSFFFPGTVEEEPKDHMASKDNLNATLLGFGGAATNFQSIKKPKISSPPKRKGSFSSYQLPPSSALKPSDQSTPGTLRRNWSSRREHGGNPDVADDIDKMKERAAKNHTFLYIKIPQFPLCVSYKGEKEKNIEDVRDFNLIIPMLVYHNMTWTWHDLAMAIKRDCKRALLSQVIKEKFHLGGSRGSHKQQQSDMNPGLQSSSNSLLSQCQSIESNENTKKDEDKLRILFGSNLKRMDSSRRNVFKKKK